MITSYTDIELLYSCWQRDKNYREYVQESIAAGEYTHSLTSFNSYYAEWDTELNDTSLVFLYELPVIDTNYFRL